MPVPCRAGAISDEELDRYKQALGRPGCLHAGLNYYRAAIDGLTWAAPAQPPCVSQSIVLQLLLCVRKIVVSRYCS